jgi:hypothetical protein
MSNTPTTSTTDTAFDWSPLGEQRARELGEAAGCSELQLRFAVARFQGASQTRAAALAGYEAAGDALRRAGYAAYRSTGVQNLLELMAINAPDSVAISGREIDAKIAKLIRSQDSNVSIKAMELFAKREAAQREADAAGETDDYRKQVDECLSIEGIYAAPAVARGWKDFVLAAPHFELYASFLKRRFPELWEKYREPIAKRAECFKHSAAEQNHLKLFDELGDRPELTNDQFMAALSIKRMASNAT